MSEQHRTDHPLVRPGHLTAPFLLSVALLTATFLAVGPGGALMHLLAGVLAFCSLVAVLVLAGTWHALFAGREVHR